MTREQAIRYLSNSGFSMIQIDTIVKALEQEPTTKNDLEVDCISRAEAIRVASGYCHPSNIAKELAKLPSVTPQEPVIDKIKNDMADIGKELRTRFDNIRAEIKAASLGKWYVGRIDGKAEEVLLMADVLQILDKYKAETE